MRHSLFPPLVSLFAICLALGLASARGGDSPSPPPADAPSPAFHPPATEFWSFQPLQRAAPPAAADPFVAGPVDAFVLEALQGAGLSPSPPADRARLARRVYFGLLGLPPAPEDVGSFVEDDRPNAYERLIDRLLDSPHYGERWARHWLDVVRFAETDGFEMNQERPNAWHYRDWVIGAFNEDLPYDRFVFLQIAGDAAGRDAATGFLVGGPYDKVKSPDEALTLMQRQDELADIVNTTGTAFLGLTLGCAKCHDHKFDPVSQKDYFAVQAVFAGVHHGERPLRDAAEPLRRRELAEMEQRTAEVDRALGELGLRPPVNPRHNVERFAPATAKFLRFTVAATNDGTQPCLDELEAFAVEPPPSAAGGPGDPADAGAPPNVALASAGAAATASGSLEGFDIHRLEHLHDGRYGNESSWISSENGQGWVQIEFARPVRIDRVEWGRDRTGRFEDRVPTEYRIELSADGETWRTVSGSHTRLPFGADLASVDPAEVEGLPAGSPPRARALLAERKTLQQRREALETVPMVYAGRFEPPPDTHLLHRGDPMAPRERVSPDALEVLGTLSLDEGASEPARRAALAKWIASAENPLTARVMVNRIWHYHFGRGIVDTPSDFGAMGSWPTHPELLDWLAGEFIASGWSVKHVHRLILLSNTYRQSSAPDPRALAVDADCRLLWRYPPRRLEAEAIRDAILSVAGCLDRHMGGPGFSAFEPNDNYVRVYKPKETFGPAEWRRMVYQTKVRMENDAVFGAFDCPDAGQAAPDRSRSTTALQALNLFNSRFILQQSERFAARLRNEAGDDPARQVERAFRIAFGRPPEPDEAAAGTELVKTHGLPALCRAVFNANEFLFVP